MKLSIAIIFTFLCSFSAISQKSLHVHYQFVAVAEKEATAQQMQAMVGTFSKDYYRSEEMEMVHLSLGGGEDFKFIASDGSNAIKLFITSGENKMVVDLDDAYYKDMKAMSEKRNPAPFFSTDKTKNIQGIKCSLSTIEAMGRSLEYWLDKTTPTNLPVSFFMKINDAKYLPLVMETVIPQREGTVSKDRIRIEAQSILAEVDKSVFEFGQDTFTSTTIEKAQEALGVSYMLLLLF